LFNFKKKVKNKGHVEASICEAYIVEEISTFISYYFKPYLRTRINRIPRHDDGGEVLAFQWELVNILQYWTTHT
jgi:hypothetical protein